MKSHNEKHLILGEGSEVNFSEYPNLRYLSLKEHHTIDIDAPIKVVRVNIRYSQYGVFVQPMDSLEDLILTRAKQVILRSRPRTIRMTGDKSFAVSFDMGGYPYRCLFRIDPIGEIPYGEYTGCFLNGFQTLKPNTILHLDEPLAEDTDEHHVFLTHEEASLGRLTLAQARHLEILKEELPEKLSEDLFVSLENPHPETSRVLSWMNAYHHSHDWYPPTDEHLPYEILREVFLNKASVVEEFIEAVQYLKVSLLERRLRGELEKLSRERKEHATYWTRTG